MEKRVFSLYEVGQLHVKCMSRSETVNPFESKWEPFHITWFRIDFWYSERKYKLGNRKPGRLYGTEPGSDHRLEEVAFTMCFWPNMGRDWLYNGRMMTTPNMGRDWFYNDRIMTATDYLQYLKAPNWWYFFILVLAPSHARGFCPYTGVESGHLAPLRLILEALRDAAESWEKIVGHLAGLVNQRGAIFAPDLHDRLLFDDDAFSRSRLYFWAIDSLESFIPSIAANIQEWEDFWAARKIYFHSTLENDCVQRDDPRRNNKVSCETIVRQVEDEIVRLRALKGKLELLRERIRTLRDGVSCQCEPYNRTAFDWVR